MTEHDGTRRRRRRPRHPSADAGAENPARPAEPPEERRERADGGARRAPAGRGRRATGESERGLRNLVGAGPSALGVEGALRARDVNRPTEQDLAEAERDVQIVRRNWKPPS